MAQRQIAVKVLLTFGTFLPGYVLRGTETEVYERLQSSNKAVAIAPEVHDTEKGSQIKYTDQNGTVFAEQTIGIPVPSVNTGIGSREIQKHLASMKRRFR